MLTRAATRHYCQLSSMGGPCSVLQLILLVLPLQSPFRHGEKQKQALLSRQTKPDE